MDDLEYSYEEQFFKQIERLHSEPAKSSTEIKGCSRFYRCNIFEEIEPQRKQRLDKLLLETLKNLGEEIYSSLEDQEEPTIALYNRKPVRVINRRNKSNFSYDKDGVIHLRSKDSISTTCPQPSKLSFMLHIVAKVVKLLEQDTYITKRGLYYQSQNFCRVRGRPDGSSQPDTTLANSQTTHFGSQSQSSQQNLIKYSSVKLDAVIDDLCCLMGCSKSHLHILSQPKGLVYGDLKFKVKNGQQYDCFVEQGVLIPTPQSPIVELVSEAKFILVLEKDCVMQKIMDMERSLGFVKRYKAILITAKGYPDVNSRAFLNFLWRKLRIPVLALTDADPQGLEIVCCYKFGCYTAAHEAAFLTVPNIKWLGLLPEEMMRHSMPDSKTKPLSSIDMSKIASLLARPYIKERPSWSRQLEIMKTSGRKAEIESLEIHGRYLVESYLPNKLRYASWL